LEKQQVAQTAEEAPNVTIEPETKSDGDNTVAEAEPSSADALFAAVREVIQRVLTAPMNDAEVAAALEVSTAQAKTWLQRLVDEGVLERQKKSTGYIVKQSRLF
jgi:DNA-directed RNA polymerase specialized sigma24 family protein